MTVAYEECDHCHKVHLDTVICNKCGGSCKVEDPDGSKQTKRDHLGFYGLLKGEVIGGYFSPVLKDLVRYRFSLCEKCLAELFATFTVPVEEQDVDLEHRPISREGIPILEVDLL